MGRYIGPQCRLCRSEGAKLMLKGDRCKSNKCPITRKRGAPGAGPMARPKKLSDYGHQLREKQKVKRIYGMLEKQFWLFFVKAERMRGVTGDNLFGLLERRLDNVVYRMHFAGSRKQARQLVDHGHIRINGKKVTIPSFLVKVGDRVELGEDDKKLTVVKDGLKELSRSGLAPWLEVDPDAASGVFRAVPRKSEVTDLADINEQLIIELYSK